MSRCDNCGGEDCVCCEVYIEQQADNNYFQEDYDGDEYYQSVAYYDEEDEQ